MTDVVYHFTDSARLPWTITSGELRPSRTQLGGFPEPNFLWATTYPFGDRTSTAIRRAHLAPMVRLTLLAEDFVHWRDVPQRFPQWTVEHQRRLERIGQEDFSRWRVRTLPLPVTSIVKAEASCQAGSRLSLSPSSLENCGPLSWVMTLSAHPRLSYPADRPNMLQREWGSMTGGTREGDHVPDSRLDNRRLIRSQEGGAASSWAEVCETCARMPRTDHPNVMGRQFGCSAGISHFLPATQRAPLATDRQRRRGFSKSKIEMREK